MSKQLAANGSLEIQRIDERFFVSTSFEGDG
jgi:hypothetical protein